VIGKKSEWQVIYIRSWVFQIVCLYKST
jgi:hypothetical protein